jgi:tetratricopeptide (TPR) repeat protein
VAYGGIAAAILCLAGAALGSADLDRRLASGASHFRAGRFDRALVEFKVARQLGARGDVTWYIAAALTKLQRPEDALEAFATAEAEAPDSGDTLLAYYRAIACHDAQLLVCADRILAEVSADAGPKIRSQAEKIRSQLAPLLGPEPPPSAIDALLSRGETALKHQRPTLAALYFREAHALSSRRSDRHRAGEADSRLKAAAVDVAQRSPRR